MSEPSFEEKLILILMKSARDAGFDEWENKESIPIEEFQKIFEKFSNNLLENLKKFWGIGIHLDKETAKILVALLHESQPQTPHFQDVCRKIIELIEREIK